MPTIGPNATFEETRQIADQLYAEVERTSAALKAFPKEGPLRLTPDAVKNSPEFKAAKRAYDSAFAALRNFNEVFTKLFAAKLREERDARRARK